MNTWRWRDNSPFVKGADGLIHSNVRFSARLTTKSHAFSVDRKDLVLGCEQEEDQITDKLLDGIFLGIKEGSEEFVFGTLAGCVVCRSVSDGLVKTLQTQSCSTTLVEHPGELCQMTNHMNPENHESNC